MRLLARPKRKSSVPGTVPTPVMGLNARDDIGNMNPAYALSLVNVFPDADRVSIRRGMTSFSTGMTGAIESIMVWNGPSSTKVLGAKSTNIYNVTGSGTASSLATGYSNGRWQHVNFTTAGGHYLCMVNGADNPKTYDGTNIATAAMTGASLDESKFINVTSHKNRLWFVETNTMNAWYLGTEAISGAASKFSMGSVFKDGGSLMAQGTYSDDAGDGSDDYLVSISSTGEILMYQGTDPSSSTTWGLVGRYKTAAPLGRRCMTNLGGDLLILTEAGVRSMKAIIKYDRAQQELASVSNKIDPIITALARSYKANFGWQISVYAKSNLLIVNVPVVENSSQHQYVMNTLTGAWCKFTGWNANCFGGTASSLYFGGNSGSTFECDYGYNDNGSNIEGYIQTAFNYFESRGTEKHFKMVRPIITSSAEPGITIGGCVDFEDPSLTGGITPSTVTAGVWNTMAWDSWVWGGSTLITKEWTDLKSFGMCLSIAMSIVVNGGSCAVNSFDVIAEPGSGI
jgi:hypothetical protein